MVAGFPPPDLLQSIALLNATAGRAALGFHGLTVYDISSKYKSLATQIVWILDN